MRNAYRFSGIAALVLGLVGPGCGGSGSGPAGPTLTSVAPSAGPLAGGTELTLTGTGFDAGVTRVTVGGTDATNVMGVSDATCTCSTPPGAGPGPVDVAIETPAGTATLEGAFGFHPPPTLSAVVPRSDFVDGGSPVLLLGAALSANDAGPNTVLIGGATAPDVQTLADDRLACTAPPGTAGLADVELSNANGTAVLADAFAYFRFPPRFDDPEVRLDTSPAGEFACGDTDVCGSGVNAYVVWADRRHGSSCPYFRASHDGGATWQTTDTRLSTNEAGVTIASRPEVCCSGNNVYVVWWDARNSGRTVYFRASYDGGATWPMPETRIDQNPIVGGWSTYPRICCSGDSVYVVWYDTRNGVEDIYFRASYDGGRTWPDSDVRLDTENGGSQNQSICCSGEHVYVAWDDTRNGVENVYFRASHDGGRAWGTSDQRLDSVAPGLQAHQPTVACGGTHVYVAWRDESGAQPDVFFRASHDGGGTWGTGQRLETTAAGSEWATDVQLCSSGPHVYALWGDGRNGPTHPYFRVSHDRGDTWPAPDVRVSTSPANQGNAIFGRIACSGTNVHVAWSDQRTGNPNMYYRASQDGGATWAATETRLNTDAEDGSQYRGETALYCPGAKAYVVWTDQRGDEKDVYVRTSSP